MKTTLHHCSRWAQIREAFDSFPHQNFGYELDSGGLGETSWVFRGHKSNQYHLQPKIERHYEGLIPWAALESKMVQEFQSRARMYFNPSDVPESSDRLAWLALMQHYGIPTRLLDFTFSPYVALFFSLIDRGTEEQKSPVELWAINTRPLMKIAIRKFLEAKKAQARMRSEQEIKTARAASLDPRTFGSEREMFENDTESQYKMVNETLAPDGVCRGCFNRTGFVALALPRIQNRRLSSQQGVFLFTGAEDQSFQQSLELMMKDHKTDWCRRIEIVSDLLEHAERELMRMNIHYLSLFPDTEGLAGYIRQKARLHWAGDPPIIEEEEVG